ncbi:MAG: metallophosphoesterase family protein [Candidatus Geothermincolia bacterium]
MASRISRRAGWLGHAWPLISVLLIIIACTSILAVQPHWLNPHLGIQDDPKITKIIYPTFGNPAIVKKGATLTVEYDPRERLYWKILPRPMSFKVSVKTSNGPAKITRSLDVKSSKIGYSTQWPDLGKNKRQERRIYLVTVAVPEDLPSDLYDLEVESTFVVRTTTDSQPHALQAVDSFKDRFSFLQITDVHVWGPEIEYPGCTYHERSKRPDGTDPNRKGAVYYQKAIDQINLVHPDFVVFSGDGMFGQRYFAQDNGPPWGITTEYEYEMMWFYQETLKLDVPVFMVMGNHDSYNEGNEGAGEDWYVNWRKLFGPIYHSFDYGDNHFVATNSQDWSAKQRVLVDWFNVILQPGKYKGEFLGGGEKGLAGVSTERLAKVDESAFTGQLAWIRDDLKAHQGSKTRIMVMHHDPYKTAGSGEMWGVAPGGGGEGGLKHMLSRVLDMGGGQGRLAIIKLMQDYRVSLEVSGHDHSDYVATREQEQKDLGPNFVDAFTWKGGGGEIIFANTTSTQFQVSGSSNKYPGYRWVWVNDGKIESFSYKEPAWSYPWYEGTNIGGTTDLDKLVTPAIRSKTEKAADGSATTFTVENTLDVELPGAYAEIMMPALPQGQRYVVDNGTLVGTYAGGGKSGAVMCQVLMAVPPRAAATATIRSTR